ncbi:unnamed protein product [Spirodela intermedia]|uniref:Uncharacterized protein n=1 Tax=Spirodela intermedia TaxID=51605 RepID=A0A7I8IQC4_SPIIN|nr:unnamed protein product [Spirodela intermedia]CAA6659992.1 unnamed protein product [Spirodela intermedia]
MSEMSGVGGVACGDLPEGAHMQELAVAISARLLLWPLRHELVRGCTAGPVPTSGQLREDLRGKGAPLLVVIVHLPSHSERNLVTVSSRRHSALCCTHRARERERENGGLALIVGQTLPLTSSVTPSFSLPHRPSEGRSLLVCSIWRRIPMAAASLGSCLSLPSALLLAAWSSSSYHHLVSILNLLPAAATARRHGRKILRIIPLAGLAEELHRAAPPAAGDRKNSMAAALLRHRKLLQQEQQPESGGGGAAGGLEAETNRMGEGGCSKDDIDVYQAASSPLPSGIPTYTVQVINTCLGVGCGGPGGGISQVHMSCGWFSSARLVNPKVFRRLGFNDCLVNDGRSIPAGGAVSFQYANTYPYKLAVSSASCQPSNGIVREHLSPPSIPVSSSLPVDCEFIFLVAGDTDGQTVGGMID